MVISTIVGKQTGQTQTTWIEEVGGGGWGVCVGWVERIYTSLSGLLYDEWGLDD